MDIGYPNDDVLAERLSDQVDAMDAQVRTSFFSALQIWSASEPVQSEIDVILNHRYDVYILEPGAGTPFIVIVHEPGQPDATIAALFQTRPTPGGACSAAADAVGVLVQDCHAPA